MSMLCGICMKPANECKCNVVVNRCADAGQQAVIEQLRAQLTAEQAKSEKLAGMVAVVREAEYLAIARARIEAAQAAGLEDLL